MCVSIDTSASISTPNINADKCNIIKRQVIHIYIYISSLLRHFNLLDFNIK
jgi:hypothetical protein